MSGVPSGTLEPIFGVDFQASTSSDKPADVPVTLLVIGQRLSTGTVAALTPFQAYRADEVGAKAGYGSQLHRMAIYTFKNLTTVPCWFVGIDDAGTATNATHVWALSGTSTAVGEYARNVAGERYSVGVPSGTAAADVAASWIIKYNANPNAQFIATQSTGTITLTAKNAGIDSGDLDSRGLPTSVDAVPAGLTEGATTITAGTVNPDIDTALAVLGDSWYNVFCQPYTDDTNMTAMQTYIDSIAGVLVMRDGVSYQFKRDTLANMITFGQASTRNNKYMATSHAYNRQQSSYELTAMMSAQVAQSIQSNPAVPLKSMPLVGATPITANEAWDYTERDQLAKAGISTLTDKKGVYTSSMVTMYLENAVGAADTTYQQQNTIFQLSSLRYVFVNWMLVKFQRAMLADNADLFDGSKGEVILTEKRAKAEAVAWFDAMQKKGWVVPSQAAMDAFKNAVVAKIDATNEYRMNWLLPVNLMKQFLIGSGVIEFE